MGVTRALVTIREGTTYINDRELAQAYIADLAAKETRVYPSDEISQRLSVCEAGMRVQKLVGGSFETPLSAAIAALRKLNSAVNVAKHCDVQKEDLDTNSCNQAKVDEIDKAKTPSVAASEGSTALSGVVFDAVVDASQEKAASLDAFKVEHHDANSNINKVDQEGANSVLDRSDYANVMPSGEGRVKTLAATAGNAVDGEGVYDGLGDRPDASCSKPATMARPTEDARPSEARQPSVTKKKGKKKKKQQDIDKATLEKELETKRFHLKRMEDFKFDGDPLVANLLEPDIQEVRMAIQRLESQVL